MKKKSLRSQFVVKIFAVLLIIAAISGIIQVGYMKEQTRIDVDNKAALIAQSIEQGLIETDLASQSIEHQIDLKMESNSRHIGDRLKDSKWETITREQLLKLKDELGLSGITLLARNPTKDDIIGVQSTEKQEIGFSIKNFSESGYQNFNRLLNNKAPVSDGFYSYVTKNLIVLPISQSGSHEEEPQFFKYAYYYKPGTNYIIAPYIQANEVHQFTNKVGPDTWISTFMKENSYVKEIGVLNPRVFADPGLETKIYPPLKKVVYGTYNMANAQDNEVLKGMVKTPKKTTYTQQWNDEKIYKMFLPMNENRVIYIALDYGEMSGPLYRHSVILILSGLLSLFALFLLTTRFFNQIYANIQRIQTQIKLLEAGDFTAKSKVRDHGELGDLSESANRMVATLNRVLADTSEQAVKAQRLALMLEAEANQSVQKMYTLSMETTIHAREQLDEIMYFLEKVERYLGSLPENDHTKEIIEKVYTMRQMAKERTAVTTDMTITLSDLLKSLHSQSTELSDLSNGLLQNISKFKLS